jgi:hypothetical protein
VARAQDAHHADYRPKDAAVAAGHDGLRGWRFGEYATVAWAATGVAGRQRGVVEHHELSIDAQC